MDVPTPPGRGSWHPVTVARILAAADRSPSARSPKALPHNSWIEAVLAVYRRDRLDRTVTPWQATANLRGEKSDNADRFG
jgi:hypothetical protein